MLLVLTQSEQATMPGLQSHIADGLCGMSLMDGSTQLILTKRMAHSPRDLQTINGANIQEVGPNTARRNKYAIFGSVQFRRVQLGIGRVERYQVQQHQLPTALHIYGHTLIMEPIRDRLHHSQTSMQRATKPVP